MIRLYKKDIGKKAIYQPSHPHRAGEEVTIISYDKSFVYVMFLKDNMKLATFRSCLSWPNPVAPKPVVPLNDIERELVMADIAYLKQKEIDSGDRAKWEKDQAVYAGFERHIEREVLRRHIRFESYLDNDDDGDDR